MRSLVTMQASANSTRVFEAGMIFHKIIASSIKETKPLHLSVGEFLVVDHLWKDTWSWMRSFLQPRPSPGGCFLRFSGNVPASAGGGGSPLLLKDIWVAYHSIHCGLLCASHKTLCCVWIILFNSLTRVPWSWHCQYSHFTDGKSKAPRGERTWPGHWATELLFKPRQSDFNIPSPYLHTDMEGVNPAFHFSSSYFQYKKKNLEPICLHWPSAFIFMLLLPMSDQLTARNFWLQPFPIKPLHGCSTTFYGLMHCAEQP